MEKLLNMLPVLGAFIMVILILVLTWYATRWYAKRMGPAISGKNIRVVDKAALSYTTALVIAEVCGKYYLIGASDSNVSLLKELDGFEENPVIDNSVSFQKLICRLVGKDVPPQSGGGSGSDEGSGNKNKNDGAPQ